MSTPEQEDNLPQFQRHKPIAVGSDDCCVPEATQHFPTYELPSPVTQKEAQDSIKMENRIQPGLKAFNVNDLIDRGLFDAAEYYLGRPLTDAERSQGMMSQAQYEGVAEK